MPAFGWLKHLAYLNLFIALSAHGSLSLAMGWRFATPSFFGIKCAVFRKLNNRTKECGLRTLARWFFCQRLIVKGVTIRYPLCDCVKPKTANVRTGSVPRQVKQSSTAMRSSRLLSFSNSNASGKSSWKQFNSYFCKKGVAFQRLLCIIKE